MAEAIVNTRIGDSWQAFSAGTKPAGNIHPLTVEVLEEIGIKHSGKPKNASTFYGSEFDLVVTVCDAAAEDCPIWLGTNPQIHLAFEDPASFEGDQESTLSKFRQVRDEIDAHIPDLLARYG
jgi:arsenate reductase